MILVTFLTLYDTVLHIVNTYCLYTEHPTMLAKSFRTLYLLLHLLEKQHKTWQNSIITHTKQLYVNNTTLGSVVVGFDYSLEPFDHANS